MWCWVGGAVGARRAPTGKGGSRTRSTGGRWRWGWRGGGRSGRPGRCVEGDARTSWPTRSRRAQQRAYLQLTQLRAIVEDTALLAVPDAYTRDVIESRLRPGDHRGADPPAQPADTGRGHGASRRRTAPACPAPSTAPRSSSPRTAGPSRSPATTPRPTSAAPSRSTTSTPAPLRPRPRTGSTRRPRRQEALFAEPPSGRGHGRPGRQAPGQGRSRRIGQHAPVDAGAVSAAGADARPAADPPGGRCTTRPPGRCASGEGRIGPTATGPPNDAPAHRMATDPSQLRDNQRRPDDRAHPDRRRHDADARGDNGPGRAPMDCARPATRAAPTTATGSTRSTCSRRSSSARPTASRTPRRSPSPSRRPRRTTRCSSTAVPGWARPTCCTRSATTPRRSGTPAPSATCPPRNSPTTSSTACATTRRRRSSGATATSTSC